jgi:two-component system, sensor histidine kinase and response regulator
MNADGDNPKPHAGKQARVLVAEDSPLNQQVALKQLEKLGFEADAVADGAQALESLSRAAYAIILMDCQMPEMNGYEATWQIRERERLATRGPGSDTRVYIIAMTANTRTDTREKCLEAGMDDFINKPVHLPELEAALQRALTKGDAEQALEEVIDPVVIAGLRQLRMPGKPDPLAEFIALFLKEAPGQLAAMEQAITSNDIDAVARTGSTATGLKGSASNLGARNLAALCDEIEQAARTGWLADAKPVLDKAKLEFARVRDALDKIRNDTARPG